MPKIMKIEMFLCMPSGDVCKGENKDRVFPYQFSKSLGHDTDGLRISRSEPMLVHSRAVHQEINLSDPSRQVLHEVLQFLRSAHRASRQTRFQAEFQTHKRKRTEGWATYAEDLKTLVEKAFPDIGDDAREQLALTRYMDQLDQPQVAFAVRQSRPKTLDDAVSTTLEMELYVSLSRGQGEAPTKLNVGAVNDEPTVSAETKVVAAVHQDTNTQLLQQLLQRMEKLETDISRSKDEGLLMNFGKKGQTGIDLLELWEVGARSTRLSVSEKSVEGKLDTLGAKSWAREGETKAHQEIEIATLCTPVATHKVRGEVEGKPVSFVLDTGAAVTLLRKDIWVFEAQYVLDLCQTKDCRTNGTAERYCTCVY